PDPRQRRHLGAAATGRPGTRARSRADRRTVTGRESRRVGFDLEGRGRRSARRRSRRHRDQGRLAPATRPCRDQGDDSRVLAIQPRRGTGAASGRDAPPRLHRRLSRGRCRLPRKARAEIHRPLAPATLRRFGSLRSANNQRRRQAVLGTILIILLILLLIGAVPRWGYSRGWGYGPSGLLGLILIIVVILLLMGRL